MKSALRWIAVIGVPLFMLWGLVLWSQETSLPKIGVDEIQEQLKIANAQIAQLEERVKLMTLQQQGVIQFLQAGHDLCELDKKQPPTKATMQAETPNGPR